MPSSTFFQTMLLSKPRVENFHGSSFKSPEPMLLSKPKRRLENFHGSRIKSAEFIVSSGFSGVKFNTSPSSNPKVRSFMCCCIKVQNFVNSTACSSTSKIAHFEEAKENYFKKVLIDHILKVVKWLKIPAVLVLLLPMTMSCRRGDSAMAASSGVIVSDNCSISSSLSDDSSSAFINGKQESSSGVFIIIFVSAVLVYILRKLYDELTRDQTKVIKLQVGLRVPISDFVGMKMERKTSLQK
ncbi:hypothetical protein Ddye_017736 [Dipteronia dyeriana]|uniref:Uncharacterized protein n=1 Tax=Dipteronia dyeriana TaxID=168575 RepID=A0AAD9UA05_9ROSI|nr:hypothetical protein Ddye_017736 [Dipteronia dyeriana]